MHTTTNSAGFDVDRAMALFVEMTAARRALARDARYLEDAAAIVDLAMWAAIRNGETSPPRLWWAARTALTAEKRSRDRWERSRHDQPHPSTPDSIDTIVEARATAQTAVRAVSDRRWVHRYLAAVLTDERLDRRSTELAQRQLRRYRNEVTRAA